MSEASGVPARERVRQALREALLEAAEQVFAEGGFEGATMAAIASRAGYSAGHLYNVFENKEALFREVFRWRASLALERLIAALGPDGTLGESLDRFVHASLCFFETHRRFLVFYIHATSGLEWNLRRFGDEGARVQQTLERELERRVHAAVVRGELAAGDPVVRTCAIMGTLHRYLARWIQSVGSTEELWAHESGLCAAIRRVLGVESPCTASSN